LIYHTIQSFFAEFSSKIRDGLEPPTKNQFKVLLEPFVQMLYLSENKRIVDGVLEEIIEKFVIDDTGTL
jgi:TolB-like protein